MNEAKTILANRFKDLDIHPGGWLSRYSLLEDVRNENGNDMVYEMDQAIESAIEEGLLEIGNTEDGDHLVLTLSGYELYNA